MKVTLRSIGRLTGAMIGILALGACAVGAPEEDLTATDKQEDGLQQYSIAFMPGWVGTCSQADATYIVRRPSSSCPHFSTVGGTWLGCNLEPEYSNGYCIYTWSPSTPGAVPSRDAYLYLQGKVAMIVEGRYAIAADCSEDKAVCSQPKVQGGLEHECQDEVECCTMRPRCWWNSNDNMCQCWQEIQPSCDVCGFSRNGILTAVIDPRWPDTSRYLVYNNRMTWIVTAPFGVQTFQVPLPGGTSYTGSVSIRPIVQ